MANGGTVVVIGGTSGIGEDIAKHYSETGRRVYVSGRDQGRADEAAVRIGGDTHGLSVDLSQPRDIAAGLAPIEGPVDYLVIPAVLRDSNNIREFGIEGASALAVLKLVGYPETIHQLLDRMHDESAVVLFGGLAKEKPYPGSLTVTSVNGGIEKMLNNLVLDLAPIRINAIHPGIVLDSWFWDGKDPVREAVLARTPTGRPVLTAHIVDAVRFLLENPSANGVNLNIDGGHQMRHLIFDPPGI